MSERPPPDDEAIRFLREELPSRVAHALRTPLGVVGGTVTELERGLAGTLDPSHEHLLQLAQRSVRQIENIASRLSLLGRLESERLEVQRQPVDVAVEVERAIEDVRTIRKRSKISVEASSTLTNGACISGDAALLRRAFMEVIDNALRFARSTVAVTSSSSSEDVSITVEDDGPGIAPEEWKRLVEPYRIRDDRSGLGIGLLLAHEIIRRHEGSLRVEAASLGGCRIIIELPTR